MASVQNRKNTLDITLYDGVSLVSLLLRTGQSPAAISLASQLLVHFPQALPLHVGLGRALLADGPEQADNPRAIRHLRRVLDADPENWRIRLETVLLYLRGDRTDYEVAGQELWLATQLAPDNRWLRDVIQRLPDHPAFERARLWYKAVVEAGTLPGPDSPLPSGQDEGSLARLFLRRKMPWMAVPYFETALRRVSPYTARLDLKTGLLLALWGNGEVEKASALASEMLVDQPQLILPRLLLTSHLSTAALRNKPEALGRLLEPVWRVDPLLLRAVELVGEYRLPMPPSLWPEEGWPAFWQPALRAANDTLPWYHYVAAAPVTLYLGRLDRERMLNLLSSAHTPQPDPSAQDPRRMYLALSEINYRLSEIETNLAASEPDRVAVTPGGTVAAQKAGAEGKAGTGNIESVEAIKVIEIVEGEALAKGPVSPAQPEPVNSGYAEIERIAASLAGVEKSLFGMRLRPGPGKAQTGFEAGAAPAGTGGATPEAQPGLVPKGPVAAEGRATKNGRRGNEAASTIYAAQSIRSKIRTLDGPGPGRQTTSTPGVSPILDAITLVVSSEANLQAKYGYEGARQITGLLAELVEAQRTGGVQSRLLLVDSAEALRKNGFDHLNPVNAGSPEQVRSLINAALPGENPAQPQYYPNTVFIVGGPDIIPFWRLPNPTFDSDREILSDNPYGARDQTYLLPERIVGRLPDAGGPAGSANLSFFVSQLKATLSRQKSAFRALPHTLPAPLPLRLLESFLPGPARRTMQVVDERSGFERDWLRATLAAQQQFLDKKRSNQLSPFFYSADAWRNSTESLRKFIAEDARICFSPPSHCQNFDGHWLKNARLLHFNLHGFRDNANWYGQGQAGRILTPPSLATLPVAFQPSLVSQIQTQGTVVFSEACYGGYLEDKAVPESIALSFLERGTAAFVGSSAISYGSAGPELACASQLSYYFWKEVLSHGSSFGRALYAAKINYARARLAAGHSLTGDDAKTLLEFMLLGNPSIGMSAVHPNFYPVPASAGVFGSGTAGMSENIQKGSFSLNMLGLNFQIEWEEEQKLRGLLRRAWERIAQKPKAQYQPIQFNQLPPDWRKRFVEVLAWLLPDPITNEAANLQTMIDLGNGTPPLPGARYAKGGLAGPAGWLSGVLGDRAVESGAQPSLFLTGQRPLYTSDGYSYPQTFHLNTGGAIEQIAVNLSRGRG